MTAPNIFSGIGGGTQQRVDSTNIFSGIGGSQPLDRFNRPYFGQVDAYDDMDEDDNAYGLLGFGKYLFDLYKQTIGNPMKYYGNFNPQRAAPITDEEVILGGQAQDRGPMTDVSNTAKNAYSYLTQATPQQLFEDLQAGLSKVGGMTVELGRTIATEPGSALGGFAYAMIGQPIEAVTGYKNQGGNAIPMTPEEQYQATKDVAGLVADIAVSRGMFRGMIKPGLHSTKLGALKDVTKANLASGAVGGLVGGAVAGMGEEDMLAQMATSTILSAPLSVVFGNYFDYTSYMKEVNTLRIGETQAATAMAAVINGIQGDIDTPLARLILTSEAFASTDNLTRTLVTARLVENVPAIIPELTRESFELIAADFDKATLAGAQFRTSYTIPQEFGNVPITPFNRQVNWNNDFDKVAYLAAKKTGLKPGSKPEAIVKNLIEQSNGTVSLDDLTRHGQMLRQRVNNMQRQGFAVPPNQIEIDARWRGITDKGFDLINRAVDGQRLQDATGQVWIKQGNQFIADGVGTVYPATSEELAKIIGMKGSLNPTAPKIDYGAVDYDPLFGMNVKGQYFKYYSDATNTALISPNPLSAASQDLFSKTGYTIAEQVVYNGEEYIISGTAGQLKNQPPRLKLVGVSNGKTVAVNSRLVARNMNKPTVDYLSSTPIKTLYRGVPKGVNPLDNSNTLGGALFYTPDESIAQNYTRGFFRRNMLEPGVVAPRNIEFRNLHDKYMTYWEDFTKQTADNTLPDDMEFAEFFATKLAQDSGISFTRTDWQSAVQKYADKYDDVGIAQAVIIDLARKAGFDGIQVDTQIYAFLPDVNAKLPPKLDINSPAAQHVLDGLFKRFLSEQILAKPELSFNDKFNKFFADTKLPLEQRTNIRNVMLSKLREEAAAFAKRVDPDQNILQSIVDDLDAYAKSVETDLRGNLENALFAQGMYMVADGSGGKFTIHFSDGRVFTKVDNVNQALEALHKQGFGSKVDLDGGGTQSIAPELASVTAIKPVIKYNELNWFGKKILEWRVGRGSIGKLNSFMTNMPARMAAFDEWMQLQMPGIKTPKLLQAWDAMAQGHDKMKNYIVSKPFQVLVGEYTTMMKAMSQLDQSLHSQVGRAAEMLSIEDITTKPALLGKVATDADKAMAMQIAGKRAQETVAALLEEMTIKKSDLATAAQAVQDKFKQAGRMYVKDGELLALQMAQASEKQLSWLHTLEIAKRIEDPTINKTQAQFLAESGLSSNKQFMAALDAQTRLYEQAAKEVGIPSSKYIAGYFPHFRALATYNRWGETGLPADFLNNIARTGIMDPTEIRMNPVEVAHRYLMGVAKERSGFTKIAKEIDKNIRAEFAAIPDTNLQQSLNKMWDDVMAKAIGTPSYDDQIANAAYKALTKSLGAKVGNNVIFDLVNMSLQGGMPILGVRDFATGMIMGQTLLGTDAMAHGMRMMAGGAGDMRLNTLKQKGAVPALDASGLVNPSAGVNLAARTFTQKAVDASLSLSLQPQSYNKTLAVIYTAAEYKFTKALATAGDNPDISKLLRDMQLDAEPLPVQQWFADKIMEGKPQEAGEIYARWMSRKIVNFYGAMYNPLNWNGTAGRLLGQYGSWATNSTQTAFDMIARGKVADMDKILRVSKMFALNAAVGYAGAELGLNLTNWLWNPLSFPSGSPLLSVASDLNREMMRDDGGDPFDKAERVLNTFVPITGFETGNYTRTLVPYSRAITAWVQAYESAQQGNSAFQTLLRALGQPLAK